MRKWRWIMGRKYVRPRNLQRRIKSSHSQRSACTHNVVLLCVLEVPRPYAFDPYVAGWKRPSHPSNERMYSILLSLLSFYFYFSLFCFSFILLALSLTPRVHTPCTPFFSLFYYYSYCSPPRARACVCLHTPVSFASSTNTCTLVGVLCVRRMDASLSRNTRFAWSVL